MEESTYLTVEMMTDIIWLIASVIELTILGALVQRYPHRSLKLLTFSAGLAILTSILWLCMKHMEIAPDAYSRLWLWTNAVTIVNALAYTTSIYLLAKWLITLLPSPAEYQRE